MSRADEEMKRMGVLNSGRLAINFLDYAGPYFDEIERNVTSQMKSAYRSGQYTESTLVAFVASLCTIDDMRLKIQSKINAMNNAME